jgi:macrolide-specific efflux system membrane fusion protein
MQGDCFTVFLVCVMKKNKPSNRRIGQIVIGIILVAVLLIVLSRLFSGGQPPQYLTAPVVRADIENAVRAVGTLQAFKQVDVGARVTGQVKTIQVKLGDAVKKGQQLAEIDPVLAKNTLRQAQLNAENLSAQQRAATARLHQSELALQRQRQMLAADATARQDVENAEMQFKVQQADLAALDVQIQRARVEVETARANLDYTHITAPIDGEVVSIVTQEGQTVIAQQQAPVIMKLADLQTMTVQAQIPEADVVRIHAGQDVYFTILGDPDRRYHGVLRAIEPAPSTDQGQQGQAVFYNALFEVPNPQRQLRIGMTTQVSIVLEKAAAALTIPVAALGDPQKDSRAQVRVLGADGAMQTRKVRTGINNRVQVQILSGLKEGEPVILGQLFGEAEKDARRSDPRRGGRAH